MYQKLKNMRKKRGYSIKEMAEFLSISKPFYSQLENQSRKLSYDMAIRIAEIFHKKPDQIFFEDHKNSEIVD